MQAAAQIQAVIELLDQIQEHAFPADRTMASYFRQRRYIGSKDKARISGVFYTILRNKLSLSWLLTQRGLLAKNRELVAAYLQLEGEDLLTYFSGQKYAPEAFRDDDLKCLAQLSADQLDSAPAHVKYNVPDWLFPELKASLGDDFEAEIMASNQQATTDVRVNTLKADRDQLNKAFDQAGFTAAAGKLSPTCLRFDRRVALFNLPAFKQGWFEVQDEGSQLLALFSNPKPGEKVVDFCAGAGGKTLAMAAMMQNKGVLHACDVHSKRLDESAKRARRAGVHNLRIHCLSSERDKWVKQHAGFADLVLVDAPCSGTGTWRRSPDSRWNLTADKLANLVLLQQDILASAQRLVKPGGRLIYATCSLLERENQMQADKFVADHPEFQPLSFASNLLPSDAWAKLKHCGNQLIMRPDLSGTDGFFAAQFVRKSDK